MEQLRVVATGAGAHIFGAAHVPALRAVGAEVVGVHDVDPAAARRVAAANGWRAVDDLDALLAIPADLAVVTAPHPFHAGIVLDCLRAGRHVLVEKPLAVAVDEADAIVAAAAQHRRIVAVTLQHRLRAEVVEARRLLADGFCGQLHRVEVVAYYPKRSLYYALAPWRGTWAGEGGGILINQGQHDIDLACHLAGAARRVVAWMHTRVQPTETEDTVEAMVEWEGGATGSIHISSAAAGGPRRVELVGTQGTLRLLPGELQAVRGEIDVREFAAGDGDPFDVPGSVSLSPFAGGGGTHQQLYADLMDAMSSTRSPVAAASDTVAALELTNAMTLSAHTDAAVDLPLDRGAYRALLNDLQRASPATEASAPAPL